MGWHDAPCGPGPDEAIVPMSGSDLPEVLGIEKLCFVEPWTRGIFEDTLANPISSSFVLRQKDSLAGYLMLYAVEKEAHILNLAVDPERRRRGHATRLLGHVIGLLEGRGIEEIFLEVRERNLAAQGLYGNYGFRPVGRRKRYYRETDEDALVMYLKIG
jgi:ribosomal-protein-alanine N-acetyltransferase